jgi:hypothetical protein
MEKLTISAVYFADCSIPYRACVLWGTKVRLLKSIVLSGYFPVVLIIKLCQSYLPSHLHRF